MSSAGRPRSSAYASAAFSAGVPCHFGSRISSNQGSIYLVASEPRRAAVPAVCRARDERRHEHLVEHLLRQQPRRVVLGLGWPRSVSGGSTTFSPPRTHSGSPWRTSTISIAPTVRTGRPHRPQFGHAFRPHVPGVRPDSLPACQTRLYQPGWYPDPMQTVRVPVPQRVGLDRRRLDERRSATSIRSASIPAPSTEPGRRPPPSSGRAIGSRRRLDDPRHHRRHDRVAAVHRRPRRDLRRARHRLRRDLARRARDGSRRSSRARGFAIAGLTTGVARRRPVRGRGGALGGRPPGGRPVRQPRRPTRSPSPRASSTGRSPR